MLCYVLSKTIQSREHKTGITNLSLSDQTSCILQRSSPSSMRLYSKFVYAPVFTCMLLPKVVFCQYVTHVNNSQIVQGHVHSSSQTKVIRIVFFICQFKWCIEVYTIVGKARIGHIPIAPKVSFPLLLIFKLTLITHYYLYLDVCIVRRNKTCVNLNILNEYCGKEVLCEYTFFKSTFKYCVDKEQIQVIEFQNVLRFVVCYEYCCDKK